MASGRLTLALPPMYSDLQACSHVYVWCRCRCIPTSRSVGMLSCKHTVPSPLYSDLQTSHVCCCCRCIPISDHVLMYAATISISRSLSMFSPGLRPPPYLLLNALLRSVYVRCCRRCIPASKHLTYTVVAAVFRSLIMFSCMLPQYPYSDLSPCSRLGYRCRRICF
jgi:hypothetical protein